GDQGAGAEAAVADGLRSLAALLCCRRPHHLAAAVLQSLVQGLSRARALLLEVAADISAAPKPPASTSAAAPRPPGAAAAEAARIATAAAEALPYLPDGLWLTPLQPTLSGALTAASEAAWQAGGGGGAGPGAPCVPTQAVGE
ncbi:hypothetical protein Agub_g7705, partial [Astrephomene gubernaculifera]